RGALESALAEVAQGIQLARAGDDSTLVARGLAVRLRLDICIGDVAHSVAVKDELAQIVLDDPGEREERDVALLEYCAAAGAGGAIAPRRGGSAGRLACPSAPDLLRPRARLGLALSERPEDLDPLRNEVGRAPIAPGAPAWEPDAAPGGWPGPRPAATRSP